MGFDGWYHNNPDKLTNDSNFMPKDAYGQPIHDFLNKKAHNDFDKILSYNYKNETKILVSHFPSFTTNENHQHGLQFCANPRFLDFITEHFDFYFIGHSHKDEHFEQDNCLIVNCGNDYDKPKVKIIDLETKEIKTITYK